MKKLLFAVCALAAISLLAPSAGFAQEWQNRIGIYTTATAADDHIPAATAGVPFNIYFVLTNPKLADGSPVTSMDAFEFKVTITGAVGTLFRLSETLPANSINVGTATDPFNSEYAVGIAAPLPVADGIASLMTWNCMTLAGGPYTFFLNPTSAPAIAGSLAINANLGGGNVELVGCQPSSGAFAEPVFGINTDVVGIESASFGGVKALFR